MTHGTGSSALELKLKSRWYADWQSPEHAQHFDHRSSLSKAGLVQNCEVFNDVQMLKAFCLADQTESLLEVGCATGEMYRYLGIVAPKLRYAGLDISQAAIARALEKYAQGGFHLAQGGQSVREQLTNLKLAQRFPVVYSKDVLHHQVEPWKFLSELLEVSGQALILRTRTRDQGETVLDPELSCQYHYDGWMPYLVLGIDELVERICKQAPQAEVLIHRNHMILGGRENRYLPKECYLPETGTAETAVGIFLNTEHSGRVQIEDRQENFYSGGLRHRITQLRKQLLG